jgi:CBS domain-containing protein
MFAIYDVEGRRFRDTLEKLRQVRRFNASKNNAHADLTEDGSLPESDELSYPEAELIANNKAIQAYRNTRHLSQSEPVYHAYQVMSHPVKSLSMEMSIFDAYLYFQKYGYQQMPVISPEHRIVGLLTVKDLMRFIIIDGEQTHYISGKRIEDIISKEVITADPVSDIRRIAKMMYEYHVSAVPIVNDKDVLVGIVSRTDILRTVMNDPPLNIWS